MKHIFLSLLLVGAKAMNAQNIAGAQIPQAAKTAFSKAHAHASGSWEREGANYEVNFKEASKTMSCVITKDGTIQETETDIKVSELPAPVKTYVAQHYKGVAIKEAAHIVKGDGETMYEAEVQGKDLLFSEAGKFIKAQKG